MPGKAKTEKTQSADETPSISLGDLKPAKGAVRKAMRVGRGIASGCGKTSNRGHRGEGQRSGRSRKRGFEGGQMPGYRRIPKLRRYTPPSRQDWLVLNVKDLEQLLVDGNALTYAMMRENGFLKHTQAGLRILGNGEIGVKLTVEAHHVSASAREKIEKAGGSVQIVDDSPAPVVRKKPTQKSA
ncbi:MAG: 50S ribosomal protein L15 [Candidatus Melainabacteria bacterium]